MDFNEDKLNVLAYIWLHIDLNNKVMQIACNALKKPGEFLQCSFPNFGADVRTAGVSLKISCESLSPKLLHEPVQWYTDS